jgi:hypothetical protein
MGSLVQLGTLRLLQHWGYQLLNFLDSHELRQEVLTAATKTLARSFPLGVR